MITNISDITQDEMVLDKETFCTQIESGSPFFSKQEIILSKDSHERVVMEGESFCANPVYLNSEDQFHTFLENNIKFSSIRFEKNPKNPAVVNSLAEEHLKIGNIDDAIKYFKLALKLKPDFLPAVANLAKCYLSKNNLEKAISLYKNLEEKGLADAKFLSNIAMLYIITAKYDEALIYLNKALKLNESLKVDLGENHFILNSIGVVYLAKKEINNAISYIRKASKINTGDYTAFNNLGVCYLFLKKTKQAEKYFKIAFFLNKYARDVVKNLYGLYHIVGDYDSSILLLDEYLKSFPSDTEFINSLGWSYFKSGQFKRSLRQLKQLLNYTGEEDKERVSKIYHNMGVVYEKMKDKRKAEEFYLKSLKTYPKANPIIFHNIINFHFDSNHYERAKDLLRSAQELYPDELNFSILHGVYFFGKQRYGEARELFYDLLNKNHVDPSIYLNLSTIEMDVFKNPSKVINLLETGYNKYPKSKSILNNFAYCNLLLGKTEIARELLKQVDCENNVFLCSTKGLLSLKDGDLTEGQRLYNKAIALASDNKDLVARINQKKCLEIGKFFLKNNNKREALRNFKKGLKFKSKKTYFEEQIRELVKKFS